MVLFNALLRDGTAETKIGKLLALCAQLMPPALVGLAAYAAYAIYLRIDQHGLTPDRVWIAVTVTVLALHAIAYLVALAWGRRWMDRCRQANIGIAGVVALIALALQTPVADPYRLSAENQYRRLIAGEVDPAAFDYGFLKFALGSAGQETLDKIAADSGKADAKVVAQRLAVLAEMDDRWEWLAHGRNPHRERVLAAISDPQRVLRVPTDLQLPDDFVPELPYSLVEMCGEKQRECLITAVDLTEAPGEELLLAARHPTVGTETHLYERESKKGIWLWTPLSAAETGATLWSDLLVGNLAAVPATHSDLRIGGTTIRLRQPGSPARFGAGVHMIQPEGTKP